MSDAFECDRCGSLQGGPPDAKVATNRTEESGGNVYATIEKRKPSGSTAQGGMGIPTINDQQAKKSWDGADLCADCAESFREWWGESKND